MLSIGIIGLPNVGKSTLFNALTDNNILAANYPFATIEPNTGIVPVPDERLVKLSSLYNNAPIKPATVKFIDIAGLVAGASQGEGLGNQFLANIRSCDAICHIVRAFNNPDVQHVDKSFNPENDISTINTELILADLQTIDKRLPKLQKESRANPKLKSKVDTLQRVRLLLDQGTPINLSEEIFSSEHLEDLQLITAKPVIYVFNVDESALINEQRKKELSSLVKKANRLFVCAKLESELRGLDEKDRDELLKSYGASESGLIQVIHSAYDILGLQSFLTAGEKEVRSWTIKKGSTAPQAAGAIHGDFEKGFIAASIVDFHDLIELKSLNSAKSSGKIRTEGKDYIMQPNDVVEFRFNVTR